jgi:hypothetical protein
MIGRKLMEVEQNGNSSGLRKRGNYINGENPRRAGRGITDVMTKSFRLRL